MGFWGFGVLGFSGLLARSGWCRRPACQRGRRRPRRARGKSPYATTKWTSLAQESGDSGRRPRAASVAFAFRKDALLQATGVPSSRQCCEPCFPTTSPGRRPKVSWVRKAVQRRVWRPNKPLGAAIPATRAGRWARVAALALAVANRASTG